MLTIRQIGFWHDSTTLFEHAIAVEDSEYIRGNLASALMDEGRNEEAERNLRVALQLAPDHWEHRNNLANVLLRTGRIDEAFREEQIALRLAPGKLSVAETMGLILLRREDYTGALAQLNHAVQLGGEPQGIAAKLNDAGASLASRGRPREAEPLIRRAIEINPTLVQSRRNLVLVLEDQGRSDEARAALQQAIQATGSRREYSDLVRELRVPASLASDNSQ
jgi:Flp pilus assembly protein TadD